jgi:hypothetical protein
MERTGAVAFARMVLLALLASLGACERKPPLAPELKTIQCPTNRPEHASATFGKARITFVCINKELANSPYLLKCDLESLPMICEDVGSLVFSRSATGDVYTGALPPKVMQQEASESDSPRGARLTVNFRNSPLKTSTFEEVGTDRRFLVADIRDLLPRGFTLVKGALCDRNATVLGGGVCNIEARSASLYWTIAVTINAERGTPIPADEYRAEIAFWLQLLDKMVVDPVK